MDRLWAMEVFVRVAECGKFSRAAESLNLANATVTGCVRNLERHLGVTLINRDTRRLRLTEEGQLFLVRARTAAGRGAHRRRNPYARRRAGRLAACGNTDIVRSGAAVSRAARFYTALS